MIIHTAGGSLPFKQFTFPDGQRHISLDLTEKTFMHATIETSIASADDLFDVLLAKDALSASGYMVSVDIRYLLGARMDRRIDAKQPATLEVVARMINLAGFHRLRVLDPHSLASLTLLNAEAVYPTTALLTVLAHYSEEDTVIIAPDAGATLRVGNMLKLAGRAFEIRQGTKKRDSQTGKLTGFGIDVPERIQTKHCLILDDICDGGGTFEGLAGVLRSHGAQSVDLFVTHGIFSKGALTGLDTVYCTDSYKGNTYGHPLQVIVIPVRMRELLSLLPSHHDVWY